MTVSSSIGSAASLPLSTSNNTASKALWKIERDWRKLGGVFGLPTHFAYRGLYDCGDDHPSAFMRPHHYYAPEYILRGEVNWRCNVYSFGWVLLELLTSGKLFDHTRPRVENHLPEWARLKLRKDKVKEVMDARLNGDYPTKDVAKMAALAALCVQREAKLRPDISTVVKARRL